MANFAWKTQSPLRKALGVGRDGVTAGQAGVALQEIPDIALMQIIARRGKSAETVRAAKKLFGIEPPSSPKIATGSTATLIWSGPDQFLAFAPRFDQNQSDRLAQDFAGIASLSDQSDGRCMIRLAGARVHDALAKLCSLDLHDTAFPVGTAAATIDHSTVNLWRQADGTDGHAVYTLLVFTSFADFICRSLLEAAAEYGVEIVTNLRWRPALDLEDIANKKPL